MDEKHRKLLYHYCVQGDYIRLNETIAIIAPDRSPVSTRRWYSTGLFPKVLGGRRAGVRVRLRVVRRGAFLWTKPRWVIDFLLRLEGVEPQEFRQPRRKSAKSADTEVAEDRGDGCNE